MRSKLERLNVLIGYLIYNGNLSCKAIQKEIADKMGANKVSISKALSGDKEYLTDSFIGRFNEAFGFPFDDEWLLGDSEEMPKEIIDDKITKIHKPTKYMEKIIESQEITLYDISAAANLKTLFVQKNQNILGKITLPNIPKCDGAMYVTGDSMDPIVKSGDIVCYKEIYDFNNIIYGEMYIVSINMDGDEYLAVKYITRSDKGDDWIRLESHNKRHSPKDFELKYVNALALVKISIRMNTMG
jgi:phage repressor protein C with HTH and peptisase S24 domain